MAQRVVVVEDEEDIALPLVRTLEREGYDGEWVDNGQKALDSLAAKPAEVVILDLGQEFVREKSTARTVWTKASHDASVNGAGLINRLLPGRKFPFPKSLYAVEDSLRFFVANNPDATIVACCAGAGTPAHAVALSAQTGSAPPAQIPGGLRPLQFALAVRTRCGPASRLPISSRPRA